MPAKARNSKIVRAGRLAVMAPLALAASLCVAQNGGQPAPASAPPLPPPGPPPPAKFQNLIPADQLSFLSSFAGQPAKALLKDKRYNELLKAVIPRTTFHYGQDMSMDAAEEAALYGSKIPVIVRDGRYVMVAGAQGLYLSARGFMWFDLQTGVALGVFYFHPTNGEPTPTLTVFSKQLTETDLGISQLPPPFVDDLNRWAILAGTPAITPRYFIPANGRKYVLLHDLDYCWHPDNTPAPDPLLCQQLNAEAAEADVNAAYFMDETHNVANATAWKPGVDQFAWIEYRNSTCGAGLACRIRVTRQRVRVLVARRR